MLLLCYKILKNAIAVFEKRKCSRGCVPAAPVLYSVYYIKRGEPMSGQRVYYEAYDDRYQVVHGHDLRWFGDEPSAIVAETIRRFGIGRDRPILELGCGEGRDAIPLLRDGYRLLATDVSPAAVDYCRRLLPEQAPAFQVLDCVGGTLDGAFTFIYAVAVLHMLVADEHRAAFYRFIRDHLEPEGAALICTMGDGQQERCGDIAAAFQPTARDCGGQRLYLPDTPCRMVSFPTLERELAGAGLTAAERGMTAIPAVFPHMMYAVVRRN